MDGWCWVGARASSPWAVHPHPAGASLELGLDHSTAPLPVPASSQLLLSPETHPALQKGAAKHSKHKATRKVNLRAVWVAFWKAHSRLVGEGRETVIRTGTEMEMEISLMDHLDHDNSSQKFHPAPGPCMAGLSKERM